MVLALSCVRGATVLLEFVVVASREGDNGFTFPGVCWLPRDGEEVGDFELAIVLLQSKW